MTDLAGAIRGEILVRGPISLARYMHIALQDPVGGYYRTGDPLGREGDFITAPEVSQMFGEMLGLWCAEVWKSLGSPAPFAWLEMGPGRGTLMHDALRATAKVPGFHHAARLFLMESNETLRAAQAARLEPYAPSFIDNPGALPPMPVIALANEFFDALPIHQYRRDEDTGLWHERLVGLDAQGAFVFVEDPAPSPLPLPTEISFFEVCPEATALMKTLATHIAQQGGAALIADYGYARPAGHDTLQAVSAHGPADPLDRPGEVDITAHVDFAALRLAAELSGACSQPPVGQGEFLRALGIEIRADHLKRARPDRAEAIQSALSRLVDSDKMGTLFKVMALAGRACAALPGFP